jgi:hypothetical protein
MMDARLDEFGRPQITHGRPLSVTAGGRIMQSYAALWAVLDGLTVVLLLVFEEYVVWVFDVLIVNIGPIGDATSNDVYVVLVLAFIGFTTWYVLLWALATFALRRSRVARFFLALAVWVEAGITWAFADVGLANLAVQVPVSLVCVTVQILLFTHSANAWFSRRRPS